MSSSSSSTDSKSKTDLKGNGKATENQVETQVTQVVPLESGDDYEVDLEPHEHPQHKPLFIKWLIVAIIGISALCVTCASSAASFTETGVSRDFHVPKEVTILSITLFVIGMGFGASVFCDLSLRVRCQKYTVEASSTGPPSSSSQRLPSELLLLLTLATVHLVFRFLTGFSGSSFLSVAGGSVSDLFDNRSVGTPMAVYVLTPFVGPVVGPLFAGFVNQNTNWRWTYWVLIIWSFIQTVALFLLVPETYVPVLLKWKLKRDQNYYAPLDKRTQSMTQAILISCYRPFQLMFFERMALLLNTWSALIFGILYLTFQAFPIIFGKGHGFNVQEVGLSFIGIGIGMLAGVMTQPFFNRYLLRQAERAGGVLPPPEARLFAAEIGGICAPVALYWLAFTTYPSVHWIVPIIASVLFGFGIFLAFTSVLTYLVVAYRPIAASSMAANSAMRYSFAASFPLFAGQMYERLGTVGATALLAGLMTLAAPLPFIFRRIGADVRAKSRFANFK
ncbi:hypothetical protein D9757_013322 [Collybiopsis confluens]|uniref:Major facilitator superfamily (MFS) profile domain-containing protein n=1 Tax=Collybiopsis confluens TaxID=2823264 RepID=A0A8H5LM40_9AGAR|nr:hypothetical protein D9757_013322 [Collybiopsis confluens]